MSQIPAGLTYRPYLTYRLCLKYRLVSHTGWTHIPAVSHIPAILAIKFVIHLVAVSNTGHYGRYVRHIQIYIVLHRCLYDAWMSHIPTKMVGM